MAIGIGNLPYTMAPVSPFDVITSQAENENIANIESLADGSGRGDGSVTTTQIANAAVTAPKIDFTTLQLGLSFISTTQTTSGDTELTLTGSSTSVTVPSGVSRLIATVNLPLISISDGPSGRYLLRVREGAIERSAVYVARPAPALGSSSTHILYINSGVTAGSHTYTLTVQRELGTGVLSTNASANAVSFSIGVL